MTLEEFYAAARGGCQVPGCGHAHGVMFLHARCHPSSGIRVSFDPETRVLRVACRECERLVVEIELPAGSAS
jgi:hypothetical protein